MPDPTQNSERKRKIQGVVDYIDQGKEGFIDPLGQNIPRGETPPPAPNEQPLLNKPAAKPQYITAYKQDTTPSAEEIAASDPFGNSNPQTAELRAQLDTLTMQLGSAPDKQAVASQAAGVIEKIRGIDRRFQPVAWEQAWAQAGR